MKFLNHAVLIAIFLFTSNGYTASFKCSKRSTAVEWMICSNPELSAKDDEMANLYRDNLEYPHGITIPQIKKEQSRWLKKRNTCTTVDCLNNLYDERIIYLREPLING